MDLLDRWYTGRHRAAPRGSQAPPVARSPRSCSPSSGSTRPGPGRWPIRPPAKRCWPSTRRWSPSAVRSADLVLRRRAGAVRARPDDPPSGAERCGSGSTSWLARATNLYEISGRRPRRPAPHRRGLHALPRGPRLADGPEGGALMATIMPRDPMVGLLRQELGALDDLGAGFDEADSNARPACPDGRCRTAWPTSWAPSPCCSATHSPTSTSPASPARQPGGGADEVWVESLRACRGRRLLERFRYITARRLEALDAMTQADFDAPSWTPAGPDETYGRFMRIRPLRLLSPRGRHPQGPRSA